LKKNFLRKAGIVTLAASMALTFSVTGAAFADTTSESEAKAAYETAKENYDKAVDAYDAAVKEYDTATTNKDNAYSDLTKYYADKVAAAQKTYDDARTAVDTAKKDKADKEKAAETAAANLTKAKADLSKAIEDAKTKDARVAAAAETLSNAQNTYNTDNGKMDSYQDEAKKISDAEAVKEANNKLRTGYQSTLTTLKADENTEGSIAYYTKKLNDATAANDTAKIAEYKERLTEAQNSKTNIDAEMTKLDNSDTEQENKITAAKSAIATLFGIGSYDEIGIGSYDESKVKDLQDKIKADKKAIDEAQAAYDKVKGENSAVADAQAKVTEATTADANAKQAVKDAATALATANTTAADAAEDLNTIKAEQNTYSTATDAEKADLLKNKDAKVGSNTLASLAVLDTAKTTARLKVADAKTDLDVAEHKRDDAYDVWQAAKKADTTTSSSTKKLAKAKNVKIKVLGNGKVKVTWSKVKNAQKYYVTYAKKGTTAYTKKSAGKATSKTLKLKKGTKYKIRVIAASTKAKNSITTSKVVKVK
jgi:chromosome segregation ATPase